MSSSEPETYEELKGQYAQLLHLLFEMIASLRGRRPRPGTRLEYDYYGFGLKIFAHASAILRLADPPSDGTLVARYKFVDFSSAMALSRTLLETYIRFVYIFRVAGEVAE